MKTFNWDDEKNERLRIERGVSFEEVVFCIENGQILDVIEHPNKARGKAPVIGSSAFFSAEAELCFLGFISPRRRLYPPACKPYGLEAEPEAGSREKKSSQSSLPRRSGRSYWG